MKRLLAITAALALTSSLTHAQSVTFSMVSLMWPSPTAETTACRCCSATGPELATSDFNADGKMDVAVTNLHGFASAGRQAAGVGRDRRDGAVDLAVADFADGVVRVVTGRGNGTFDTPTPFGVGAHPTSLAIADYNRDGRPDLVVANRLGNSLSILHGTGAGRLRPDETRR